MGQIDGCEPTISQRASISKRPIRAGISTARLPRRSPADLGMAASSSCRHLLSKDQISTLHFADCQNAWRSRLFARRSQGLVKLDERFQRHIVYFVRSWKWRMTMRRSLTFSRDVRMLAPKAIAHDSADCIHPLTNLLRKSDRHLTQYDDRFERIR